MKFKKEYRWLLFLIIPFIVFMFVLFMAPLQIVINAQPLATQAYALQKAASAQNHLRSASYHSSDSVNNYLLQATPILDLFADPDTSQFYETNVVAPLNAHAFYKNSTQGDVSRQTMWFATGKETAGQLSAAQAAALKAVGRRESELRAALAEGSDLASGVVGVSSFYDVGGTDEDMVFHFPAYREPNYSSLNFTVDQSLYQALNATRVNNQTLFILIPNSLRNGLQQHLVSLCRMRTGTTPGYTCLDFNKTRFNDIARDSLGSIAVSSNFYLVSPELSGYANASILTNITAPDSAAIVPEQEQEILSDLLAYHPLQPSVFTAQAPYLFTIRTSRKTYYLLRLAFWEESTSQSHLAGYLVWESFQATSSVVLQSTDVLGSSLNSLLIPTFILIFISLVISVVVLRFLMNGLDLELHRLNERCKFIFDGDLEIEIPEYSGTKDILEVYEEVKIINKLHRYSSKDYFVGHWSNRIFKYNEALQVVNKLRYDPSNLMENIGEAYIYIEEYDKSIYYLKDSVRHCEKAIEEDFGGLDRMVLLKQEREKLPNAYKDLEIILIRRLWKLVFCMFKYVELQIINAKQLDQQDLTEAEKTAKKERLQKETLDYIAKLKKALYPDFKSYAESCMLLNFEIKFMMSIKNFEGARESLGRCLRVTQAYVKEYDEITKRLKEKGSKNLYFFRKNKLSGHSRSSPLIMEAFYNYTRCLLLTNDPRGKDYATAFDLLADALRKNLASHSVNYLLINEMKKLLGTLKISLDRLETTQVFRQSMPYKTLHYGPITKQIEPTLYRLARNPAEVQCREYVILLDASYYYSTERELTDQLKYMRQRAEYLYDKLVKKWDRVSLVQANSEIGVQTLCSLTLKEFNEMIIRKSLLDMTNYQFFSGRNELIPTLEKLVYRTRNLQCEKVIVVHLKYLASYLDQHAYKGKLRHKSKTKRKLTEVQRRPEDPTTGPSSVEEMGEEIEELMSIEGLRNCKLLLMCATGDEYEELVRVWGLRDINRRIWSRTDGLNRNNNVVYVIDEKHKNDLDRILMSKLSNVSDNHVFAL